MSRSRLYRNAGINVVLAAVYFAAAKFGLRLAFVNASATAIWAPAGISLAALLLLGYRAWPASPHPSGSPPETPLKAWSAVI